MATSTATPAGCYVAVQHNMYCKDNAEEFFVFVAVQQNWMITNQMCCQKNNTVL
jgi:hypothetical protein